MRLTTVFRKWSKPSAGTVRHACSGSLTTTTSAEVTMTDMAGVAAEVDMTAAGRLMVVTVEVRADMVDTVGLEAAMGVVDTVEAATEATVTRTVHEVTMTVGTVATGLHRRVTTPPVDTDQAATDEDRFYDYFDI